MDTVIDVGSGRDRIAEMQCERVTMNVHILVRVSEDHLAGNRGFAALIRGKGNLVFM